jgi:glycosyltransferase involved in cell wall biosynthesis
MKAASLVIPVYRNEEGIHPLLSAISTFVKPQIDELEVVFVVDGSPDRSAELLAEALVDVEFDSKLISHSRNFGAFTAIRTGIEFSSKPFIVVMAADLQEPPELMPAFVAMLEGGEVDVVFGKRTSRDDGWFSQVTSGLFWSLYRRYVFRDMPKGGVDVFGCNEKVKDAVLSIAEPNSSLVAQLFWVGFRRAFVPYERRRREIGKSAWSFSRRFRYMLDSIFSFSDLPIMFILWLGLVGCAASVVIGLITAVARVAGAIPEAGYATTLILIIFFGSLSLVVQGIIGCYLWRTAENTKHRPLRILNGTLEFKSRKSPHV